MAVLFKRALLWSHRREAREAPRPQLLIEQVQRGVPEGLGRFGTAFRDFAIRLAI